MLRDNELHEMERFKLLEPTERKSHKEDKEFISIFIPEGIIHCSKFLINNTKLLVITHFTRFDIALPEKSHILKSK